MQAAPVNWKCIRERIAIAVFLAVGTAIVMAPWLVVAMKSPQTGWDFPVFYIAGRLPLHLLYSRDAFAAFWQQHLAPLEVPHWAPYVRPSIFSFLLRPIAALPYFQALWLWLGAGLTAYIGSIALIIRKFRLPGFLLPAFASFFPAMVGIIGGADTSFFLFALVLVLLSLEQKHDGVAAAVLTVCLCKFNLVFLIPVMLVLHRRYKALIMFGIGAVSVAIASISLTPLGEYVAALIEAPQKTAGFYPVGLRGFSLAIGQPWCYPVLAAATLVLCCWLMARFPLSEAFCIALTGSLLISPYICWYDSTLLVLPLAVIFADSVMAVRIGCVVVLLAVPLWEHGGGNNGPIGFMHVGAEALILVYFVHRAGVRLNVPRFNGHAERVRLFSDVNTGTQSRHRSS